VQALLYTSSSGERRIRVLTSQLPTTNFLGEMYQHADVGASTNLMTRIAIEQALNSRMVDACNMMQTKCIEVLKMYRSLCGPAAGGANLVFPESLKLLSLNTLALLKNQIFHTKGDVPIDTRVAQISRVETLSVPLSTALTIPHAFKIDALPSDVGTEVDGQIVMPALTPLSLQYFDPAGAYLIDNGHRLYVWLGGKVPETFFSATLGCSAPRDAATFASLRLPSIPQDANDSSAALARLVAFIRSERNAALQPIKFLLQGDAAAQDPAFLALMVEDRTQLTMAYAEFLAQLHKNVMTGGMP